MNDHCLEVQVSDCLPETEQASSKYFTDSYKVYSFVQFARAQHTMPLTCVACSEKLKVFLDLV